MRIAASLDATGCNIHNEVQLFLSKRIQNLNDLQLMQYLRESDLNFSGLMILHMWKEFHERIYLLLIQTTNQIHEKKCNLRGNPAVIPSS
jgi:hypothetical protein